MRQWWAHISDESLWPNERLFFEVYGQALQGRPGTVELLDGIVDSWLEPAAQGFMAYGLEREEALAQARLGLAVSRGLLLDLLATGDRDGGRRRQRGLHRPDRDTTGRIFRSPFAGPALESAHTTRRGHRRAGRACASGPGTRGAAAVLRRARERAGSDAAGGHARARAAPRRPGGRRARPGHEDPAHAGAAGRHAQRPGLRRRGGRRAALRAREPSRARARRRPTSTRCARRSRRPPAASRASAGARPWTGSPPPTASCASTSTERRPCAQRARLAGLGPGRGHHAGR